MGVAVTPVLAIIGAVMAAVLAGVVVFVALVDEVEVHVDR